MLIKNTSIAILFVLFALCSNVFAQDVPQSQPPQKEAKPRYLQVSTNPSTVDLYVGSVTPDYANRPDFTSPAFIPVPNGDDNVTVSFFHPNYADTTINIKLSSSDTSFIIVALKQTYDDDVLAMNGELLKHRSRRNLGYHLKWFSIAPFAISGISAIVTIYDISKAKDHKKAMQNTRFANSNYDKHSEEFKDYKESAKTAKNVSKIFFGTGLLFLAAGFALSF